MKPRAIVILTAALYLVLLGAAFAWDSARLLIAANSRIVELDGQMREQERRYVAALPAKDRRPQPLTEAVDMWDPAPSSADRRRAFEEVVAQSRDLSSVDPADPLRRHAADELAGALNRRGILARELTAATAAYNTMSPGLRGRIGRAFTGIPELHADDNVER